MELTIKDRLLIPVLFSDKGTFKEYNLKKEIRTKIHISDEEKEEINFKVSPDTNLINWDKSKEVPLSVDFTSEEKEYLKSQCELNHKESLSDELWEVIEKVYNHTQE